MTRNNFLNKLKIEEKLELVEPSEEICNSYSEKSANCLKSAKLLLQNNLYENSISMSYYAAYNLLIALLFRVGIKCENHSGSILLLKLVFKENELFKFIPAGLLIVNLFIVPLFGISIPEVTFATPE